MSQSLYDEANRVLPAYPLRVHHINILQGEGSRKALWRVSSAQGEYLLKRSHYPLEKILFSIYAQLFVLKKGTRVPPILRAYDGLPYVHLDGTTYIVYKWLPEARNPDFAQKEDLKQTIIALGQFHKSLEGYIPPIACEENWREGKGTADYIKLIRHLNRLSVTFKKEKKGNYANIIEYFPKVIHRSEKLLERLQEVGFDSIIEEVRQRRLLTHEDFGAPNALIVRDTGYVIDIDGLAYNLPSRDLGRVILKGMRKQGMKESQIQQMIRWYDSENRLTKQEQEIMLLEMSFPHQLLRVAHSDLREGNISSKKYQRVIEFEDLKYSLLSRMKL